MIFDRPKVLLFTSSRESSTYAERHLLNGLFPWIIPNYFSLHFLRCLNPQCWSFVLLLFTNLKYWLDVGLWLPNKLSQWDSMRAPWAIFGEEYVLHWLQSPINYDSNFICIFFSSWLFSAFFHQIWFFTFSFQNYSSMIPPSVIMTDFQGCVPKNLLIKSLLIVLINIRNIYDNNQIYLQLITIILFTSISLPCP